MFDIYSQGLLYLNKKDLKMSTSANRNAEPETLVELERRWRELVYREDTKDNKVCYHDAVIKLLDETERRVR